MANAFFSDLLATISERRRNLLRRGNSNGPKGDAPELLELCEALLSGRGEASGTVMAREVLDRYVYRQDVNLASDNIWQTKLMVGNVRPERYLLDPKDLAHPEVEEKLRVLTSEMREVFHLT